MRIFALKIKHCLNIPASVVIKWQNQTMKYPFRCTQLILSQSHDNHLNTNYLHHGTTGQQTTFIQAIFDTKYTHLLCRGQANTNINK